MLAAWRGCALYTLCHWQLCTSEEKAIFDRLAEQKTPKPIDVKLGLIYRVFKITRFAELHSSCPCDHLYTR